MHFQWEFRRCRYQNTQAYGGYFVDGEMMHLTPSYQIPKKINVDIACIPKLREEHTCETYHNDKRIRLPSVSMHQQKLIIKFGCY